jgi:serine/threonine protein kinase
MTLFQMFLQTNVLIDDSKRAKLCDFGLVTVLADTNTGWTTTSSYNGTLRYHAPELLNDDVVVCTGKGDIYALGCLALEVSPKYPHLTSPFSNDVLFNFLAYIPSTTIRKAPTTCSTLCSDRVQKSTRHHITREWYTISGHTTALGFITTMLE